MDQKRSRKNQSSSWQRKNNKRNKEIRFWWRHVPWSHFNRGLFWGSLVGLTSILSAIGGVALTKIDLVEHRVSQALHGNFSDFAPPEDSLLPNSLQILLVEVKPDANALVGFSKTTKGKIKAILLLKLEPDLDLARLINIPLNSKTKIPRYGQGTVEDAYKIGGMDLLSPAVNGLFDDLTVDRYLRTTPKVFKQLTDSSKVSLENCDPSIEDCFDQSAQVVRQEAALQTIQEQFNIPRYLANFEKAVIKADPQLDTDISLTEIVSIAHFIKELEPTQLTASLLPRYTPGKGITHRQQIAEPIPDGPDPLSGLGQHSPLLKNKLIQSNTVAVQNTTNNPQLARQVVAYLKQRNFRQVYLVKPIPLKLKKTRIISNYGQVETANYLKNILGFGNLEAESSLPEKKLILQLGEDARDFSSNYRFYR